MNEQPRDDMYFQGSGISLRFGGLTALSDVSFHARRNSLQAIIGPNGAGKTSLFNVITGFYRMDEGKISLDGELISGLPPHLIARRGIARTFQNLEIFTNMTVMENVLAGGHLRAGYGPFDFFFRTPRFFREERHLQELAKESLDFVGLYERRDLPAEQLPFGSQRLLEIARALAAQPKALLLDEPAAGLNMKETAALGELIRRIVDNGITVVMVEHDMNLVMKISERIMVLNYGRVIADGTPAEVRKTPAVIAAYLGEEE
ncbi:MAG: ABC transporter ATP-binding protein [Syntrophorhabdaceae bacterium]|nr:ABC transporter ATP-binding protein [Syntrophorhabdaceae bacterium]